MLHNNLSSLNIISIEKFEAKFLNIDDIIDAIAETYNNCTIILKQNILYLNFTRNNIINNLQ